jgi:signal transduction histidine kinase
MDSRPLLRYVRDALVFAPCYIALDWASYIAPFGPFNITPWNPQPALAVVWMLLAGVHHAPVVLLAIALADLVVRQAPAGYLVVLTTSLALTCGYAGIAWVLRSVLRLDPPLRSTRELVLFAATVLIGAGIVALAFVGVLHANAVLPPGVFAEASLKFWIGDAVGMLVTAPLLLAAANAERRKGILALIGRPEALLQFATLAAVIWLVFRGLGGEPTRFFYLLFLPLVWIAVRGGLNGAALGVLTVQIGVVIGIGQVHAVQIAAVELQALLAALALTGLFLGIIVDERELAEHRLRHSLRLAAAGEMAGAIAHEVNQPLTALANYGQSARMLLTAGGATHERLLEVIGKMLAEAERASEIVRRLRDFFRSGTTRLESIPLEDLLSAARTIGKQVIGDRAIALEVRGEEQIPALSIDRLQIELVLRNLIANAVDALDALPPGEKWIRVLASREGQDRVLVVVADNGPGLAPEMRKRLFEPFASGKASGMGLGLAVSRAIAEAHGGSLESARAGHCEFRLLLPVAHAHE